MRLNSMLLLLSVAALLFAESQPGTPGRRIEVRTSNSSVEITGWDSNRVQVDDASHATVETSGNGTLVTGDGAPLRLQVPRGSSLDISTSNGSIVVHNAGAAELHAHTSNGSIEIGIPPGMNANLSARTSNGPIRSDVEVTTSHTGSNFLEGRIGRGGPAIELQTSNGAIRLRSDGQREKVNTTFKPDEVK